MEIASELALELLAKGEQVRLVARGGSMRPLIREGDRLVLDPRLDGAPVGSVVLKVVGGQWLVHRIIARLGALRYLKGDALPKADGWFRLDELSARLVHAQRGDRDVYLGGHLAAAGSWLYGAASHMPGAARLKHRARALIERAL